jgi:hypothetical protein
VTSRHGRRRGAGNDGRLGGVEEAGRSAVWGSPAAAPGWAARRKRRRKAPDPGPAEADIAPWVEYRPGNGPVGGFSSGWADEVGRHQWVVK